MSDVPSPFVSKDDPDRHIRCQDALQFIFRDMIDQAVAAGWSEREAIAAIGELAHNHTLMLEATDAAASLFEVLRKLS